jgi:hypothetical protein
MKATSTTDLSAEALSVKRRTTSPGRTPALHARNLDSATQRTDAHRFYIRERMSILAFHFVTEL